MKHECYICVDPLKAYSKKETPTLTFIFRDTVLIDGLDVVLRDKKKTLWLQMQGLTTFIE